MGNQKAFPKRPPRLARYFDQRPLLFITFNTWKRQPTLATEQVHAAFIEYCRKGESMGVATVGRYVVMPDHVHLFVRGGEIFEIGVWVRGLKRAIGRLFPHLSTGNVLWQDGFFDHVLRSDESYAEQQEYVWKNPVRRGLVKLADDWPFQGVLASLGRA